MIKINFKNGNFALLPEGDYQAIYHDAQKKQVKAMGKPDSGVNEVRIDDVQSISMINPNDLRAGGIILMQNGETETRVIEQGDVINELQEEIRKLNEKIDFKEQYIAQLQATDDSKDKKIEYLEKTAKDLTHDVVSLLHRPFWLRVFNVDTTTAEDYVV